MFKENFGPDFENTESHLNSTDNNREESKNIPDINNLEEILHNNFFIGFNDFSEDTRINLYEKFKNHFSKEDITYSKLIKNIGEDLISLKLISAEQFESLTKNLPKDINISDNEYSYKDLKASPQKGIEQLISMLPKEQLAGDLSKEDVDKLATEFQEYYKNAYEALQNPETEENGEKMIDKLKEKIQLRRYFYNKD